MPAKKRFNKAANKYRQKNSPVTGVSRRQYPHDRQYRLLPSWDILTSVRYFTVVAVVVLALVGWLALRVAHTSPPRQNTSSQESSPSSHVSTPVKAAFLIYTNNVKRTFAASMYHRRSSEVYLLPDNPQIVYVTQAGITWGMFFQTLPMSVSPECLITGTKETFCTGSQGALRFFINGEEDNDALERAIAANDRLLISYGLSSELELSHQIQAVPNPAALDTPEPAVEQ